MSAGIFITFEGTEGGGKSTQIQILAERLRKLGHLPCVIREPGGTPVGEEIRHTLKHSAQNEAMTAEAELLLMNASRAQLVREVIRPALAKAQVVLSDRFFDSTVAYQGYGRGLDLKHIRSIIDFAVGDTRPNLTLLLQLPVALSERRRQSRNSSAESAARDRFEEAGREFFQRVEQGFAEIAQSEPHRVKCIDASGSLEEVSAAIWQHVEPVISQKPVARL